jgi:glucose/arabinose dehydrogenase
VIRGSLLAAALAVVATTAAPAAAVVVTVPDLENRILATGLNEPTAIAWIPDGRLLIAEKEGLVKLVTHRSAPFGREILDISERVSTRDDSGLLGIEVDRDFARNGFIYLSYTYDDDPSAPGAPKTARLSRFKLAAGGKIVGGARGEKVLLGKVSRGPCPPPANDVDCMPTDHGAHSIGAVRAARDGTLWVGMGDGSGDVAASRPALRAYDERSYAGKLLHIDRRGRGVRGHPFCPAERDLRQVCTKVFAMGFRNPFRFSLAPDGAPIVGDVGWGLREEIDVVKPGLNYGWPCYEGELRTPGFDAFQACQQIYALEGSPDAPERPAYQYDRPPNGAAVIAGPLFPESGVAPPFSNAFFFGDYGTGGLSRLTGGIGFTRSVIEIIATHWRGVDLRPGPGGVLSYVDIAEGFVGAIAHAPANKTPTASVQATPAYGALPLRVKLSAAAEDLDGDALSYRWRLGDGERASGPTVRHTYRERGTYVVRLVVRDGDGGRTVAAARIFAGNTPPRGARIVSPTDGHRYVAGSPVRLRAVGRDPEDGRLRGRALRWRLTLRHDDHNHYVGEAYGRKFTFRPLRDHDANSYYTVSVAATDSDGLLQSEPQHEIALRPKTTRLSLISEPAGAPMVYGSAELLAPVERRAAVGHRTTVTAAATFESDGVTFRFSSWSDGASRRRRIVIGPRPSRFTALYVAAG